MIVPRTAEDALTEFRAAARWAKYSRGEAPPPHGALLVGSDRAAAQTIDAQRSFEALSRDLGALLLILASDGEPPPDLIARIEAS